MEKLKLTSVEQEKLKEFRVCFHEGKDDDFSISINQLFDPLILENYIAKLQTELQAPDRRVTSSLFSKRYAYLIIAASLYAFSVLNKLVNVSPDNLALKASNSNDYWLPELHFINQQVSAPHSIEERHETREALVGAIFRDHLNQLWNHLSSLGKIPKQILWENTSIYLFWLYETLLAKEENPEIKARLKEDFHYILFQAEGSLFGSYNKNPLTKFYHEKSIVNGEAIRIRRTCCFAHELDKENSMCKTCPRKC